MTALVLALALSTVTGQVVPADAPVAQRADIVHQRALIPAIFGAVVTLGGFAFLLVGEVQFPAAADDAARMNATSNIVGGVALMGAGLLIAGVGVVMRLWEPKTPAVSVSLWPTADGGRLVFSARFQ